MGSWHTHFEKACTHSDVHVSAFILLAFKLTKDQILHLGVGDTWPGKKNDMSPVLEEVWPCVMGNLLIFN